MPIKSSKSIASPTFNEVYLLLILETFSSKKDVIENLPYLFKSSELFTGRTSWYMREGKIMVILSIGSMLQLYSGKNNCPPENLVLSLHKKVTIV